MFFLRQIKTWVNSYNFRLTFNDTRFLVQPTEGFIETFLLVKADFWLPNDNIPIWNGTICFALVVSHLPFLDILFQLQSWGYVRTNSNSVKLLQPYKLIHFAVCVQNEILDTFGGLKTGIFCYYILWFHVDFFDWKEKPGFIFIFWMKKNDSVHQLLSFSYIPVVLNEVITCLTQHKN